MKEILSADGKRFETLLVYSIRHQSEMPVDVSYYWKECTPEPWMVEFLEHATGGRPIYGAGSITCFKKWKCVISIAGMIMHSPAKIGKDFDCECLDSTFRNYARMGKGDYIYKFLYGAVWYGDLS